MAAALGNVDDRDNWKVHFRDTMRGGKFLNQWRMAELHARQAPERVRELEDGEIQIEFEGHGFLRHQVRIMVGTLIDVGRGRSGTPPRLR